MGWRPQDFWQSTPMEFFQAIEGWKLANGVKDSPEAAHKRFRYRLRLEGKI